MGLDLFHKVYSHTPSSSYLIVVHGLFGMLDNWHNIAKNLSKHINVVTVDCRNHGKSPHSNEMSYSLMANDLKDLMTRLSIDQAHVLGHSMGGKVAMAFVNEFPELVDKLVVVDIAPKSYGAGHQKYFRAFKEIDFASIQSRKEADTKFQKYESNVGVRQFLLKNLERTDDGYKLKCNVPAIEAFYENLLREVRFNWQISTETLFISGGNSSYIQESDHEQIEETFTNCTFEEIEDAGHWVHAEQPLPFIETLLSFIG